MLLTYNLKATGGSKGQILIEFISDFHPNAIKSLIATMKDLSSKRLNSQSDEEFQTKDFAEFE